MIKYSKVGDKMQWTEEQQNAINLRNCNLLVSAGAGSGKTAVLVERIINKVINEKIDINKILVVTFTNAAASEMKERILNKLYEKLEKEPQDLWIQKQIINILLCKTCVLIIYIVLFITNKDCFYDLNSIFKNNTILQKTQNLKGFDEKMLINLISKINSANWLKKM